MVEGEIIAWETKGEGDHLVEVVFSDHAPEGAKGAFLLVAKEEDEGLIMPYSQFSCADGIVANTKGLSMRFPLGAGLHHIFISSVFNTGKPAYLITITPPEHPLMALNDDLPLVRAADRDE